ncbi:MAG: hypothetical protein FWF20_09795 [Betaproteobacteria bacterium]|nr:hypothetical protein [Betaproteobacteria bacterium]MCL2887053.1 hypothetical protein [Betaproteobacteria bacterium]
MAPTGTHLNTAIRPLFIAWLILVALTILSIELGAHFHGAAWLQVLVAVIVWIKGTVVARHFIEEEVATPFIRNVLRAFIAYAPLALVLTAFFGTQFARWATL